jgi:hypothetical protein
LSCRGGVYQNPIFGKLITKQNTFLPSISSISLTGVQIQLILYMQGRFSVLFTAWPFNHPYGEIQYLVATLRTYRHRCDDLIVEVASYPPQRKSRWQGSARARMRSVVDVPSPRLHLYRIEAENPVFSWGIAVDADGEEGVLGYGDLKRENHIISSGKQ